MSGVRVQIRNVDDETDRHLVDMPTVPRNGDYLAIRNQNYVVTGISYNIVPAERRNYVGAVTNTIVFVGKR